MIGGYIEAFAEKRLVQYIICDVFDRINSDDPKQKFIGYFGGTMVGVVGVSLILATIIVAATMLFLLAYCTYFLIKTVGFFSIIGIVYGMVLAYFVYMYHKFKKENPDVD